jgi:pyrroline-5-carboxylate reductase
MQPFPLAWYGIGNMGMAMLEGAIRAGVVRADDVIVIEPDADKRAAAQRLGCRIADQAPNAGSILLAVKPQTFPDLAKTIALARPTLVLSIMAGRSSQSIRAALGPHARVVRLMPNTPCRIGAGMTGVARGQGATADDEAFAMRLASAVGKVLAVDEHLMHAVTAVSASGPAYIFLLSEAMEEAARTLGFTPDAARLLVRQTILGAAKLLSESPDDAAALRAAVTSKGGTTEAAIRTFEEGGFTPLVVRALTAARDRGAELDR